MEPTTGQREAAAVALGHFALHPPKLFLTLAVFSSCGLDDTNVKNEFCEKGKRKDIQQKRNFKKDMLR